LFAISDPPFPNYNGGPTRWGRTKACSRPASQEGTIGRNAKAAKIETRAAVVRKP